MNSKTNTLRPTRFARRPFLSWPGLSAGAIMVAVLAGCASPHRQPVVVDRQPVYSPYAHFGQVAAIDRIRLGRSPSGAGAVIGGIAGAVLGSQIGGGNGRAGMTVLGAAGGAVIGNSIEANRNAGEGGEVFRITVRMDDGSLRAFDYEQLGEVRLGSRVRVEDNKIFLY